MPPQVGRTPPPIMGVKVGFARSRPPPTLKGDEMTEKLKGAILALKYGQQQIDEGGVFVGVSREALDEVLRYVDCPKPPQGDDNECQA